MGHRVHKLLHPILAFSAGFGGFGGFPGGPGWGAGGPARGARPGPPRPRGPRGTPPGGGSRAPPFWGVPGGVIFGGFWGVLEGGVLGGVSGPLRGVATSREVSDFVASGSVDRHCWRDKSRGERLRR